MSPLSAENVLNPDVAFKDKFASWLASQGATTVLLFAIFWAGYAKIEILIDRVDSGYARNAADLLKVAEQRDQTLERLIAQWKEDRSLLIEILRSDGSQVHLPDSVN